MEITITLHGHEYTATITRGPQDSETSISICRDGIWTGRGTLRYGGTAGYVIDNCPAVLDEEVYEALERETEDAFARGIGAEVDPLTTGASRPQYERPVESRPPEQTMEIYQVTILFGDAEIGYGEAETKADAMAEAFESVPEFYKGLQSSELAVQVLRS